MVKAYILIKTDTGKEDDVLRQIHSISATEAAHKVFGAFDIVAEVKARDMESIVEIITMKIRLIDGIIDTQSLLVVDVELDMTSTSLAT